MQKLAILGVGGVVVGLAAALVVGPSRAQQKAAPATPAAVASLPDTGSLRGPRQPIFFRHDIHAGQYKIQCQYCHYSVAYSPEPGIPTTQTCMGCHLVIGGSDSTARAEIQKVRQAWNEKKPTPWVRIHALARHVHFPHQRHVKAMGPQACMTCHGDVQRMPQVFRVNNIYNMGWCITCHNERNVSRDCSVCHY